MRFYISLTSFYTILEKMPLNWFSFSTYNFFVKKHVHLNVKKIYKNLKFLVPSKYVRPKRPLILPCRTGSDVVSLSMIFYKTNSCDHSIVPLF